MAVVVVGDFPDPAAVLGLIQQHLGPAFEEAAAAGLVQLQGGPEVPRVLPESWQHSEPRYALGENDCWGSSHQFPRCDTYLL
jgi:hypothetical protein